MKIKKQAESAARCREFLTVTSVWNILKCPVRHGWGGE